VNEAFIRLVIRPERVKSTIKENRLIQERLEEKRVIAPLPGYRGSLIKRAGRE